MESKFPDGLPPSSTDWKSRTSPRKGAEEQDRERKKRRKQDQGEITSSVATADDVSCISHLFHEQ